MRHTDAEFEPPRAIERRPVDRARTDPAVERRRVEFDREAARPIDGKRGARADEWQHLGLAREVGTEVGCRPAEGRLRPRSADDRDLVAEGGERIDAHATGNLAQDSLARERGDRLDPRAPRGPGKPEARIDPRAGDGCRRRDEVGSRGGALE